MDLVHNCIGYLMKTAGVVIVAVVMFSGTPTAADEGDFELGPPSFVQIGSVDIAVPGYSVPSAFDWNNDGLADLIVGEGGGATPGKVRVYPNSGNNNAPVFETFFYAQSDGADLMVPAAGCLGAFPRVTYWDGDGAKDLLIGQADGLIALFLNTGSDHDPVFGQEFFLQVGPFGSKVDIDVGARATPVVVDWNNDGRKDLVVGAYDGHVRIFLNHGTDNEPDFLVEDFALSFGQPLILDTLRTSPAVGDVTADGKKDLILGDTEGRLLLYANTASNDNPSFLSAVAVNSQGVPIDLDSSRSRPALCDWDVDGMTDVLLGSSDGTVRIYLNARGIFTDGMESGDASMWSSVTP